MWRNCQRAHGKCLSFTGAALWYGERGCRCIDGEHTHVLYHHQRHRWFDDLFWRVALIAIGGNKRFGSWILQVDDIQAQPWRCLIVREKTSGWAIA